MNGDYTSDEGEILRIEAVNLGNRLIMWNTGEWTSILSFSPGRATIKRPTGETVMILLKRS